MSNQNNANKNKSGLASKEAKKTSLKSGSKAPKRELGIKNGFGQGAADHQKKKVGGSFQARDITSLIHNQGKARLGGQEWCLKAPSWSDSSLQAIISDPKLTARPINKSGAKDCLTFELCGHGKTIHVTISH